MPDPIKINDIPKEETLDLPEPTELPAPGLEPYEEDVDPQTPIAETPPTEDDQTTPAEPVEGEVTPAPDGDVPPKAPDVNWQAKYQANLAVAKELMSPPQYAAFKAQTNATPVDAPPVAPLAPAAVPVEGDAPDSLIDMTPGALRTMMREEYAAMDAGNRARAEQTQVDQRFISTRKQCDAMMGEMVASKDAAGKPIFADDEVKAIMSEVGTMGLDLGSDTRAGNPEHYAMATKLVMKELNILHQNKGLGVAATAAETVATDKARSLNDTLQPPPGAAPVTGQPKTELDEIFDGIKKQRPPSVGDLMEG